MGEGAREASLAPFTGRGCRQAGEGQRNGCKPKHLCDRSTSVEEKVLRIQVLAQPLGLRRCPSSALRAPSPRERGEGKKSAHKRPLDDEAAGVAVRAFREAEAFD